MPDGGRVVSDDGMTEAATRAGVVPGPRDDRILRPSSSPRTPSSPRSPWARRALLLLLQLALIAGGDWYIVGRQVMSTDSGGTGQAAIVHDTASDAARIVIAEKEKLSAVADETLLRVLVGPYFDTDMSAMICEASHSTLLQQDR
jgi:hypothetical protein